jgi:integrase
MINRENYKIIKEYLQYLSEVKQLDAGTVVGYWSSFKYLLNYADDCPLYELEGKKNPTLPEYLRTITGNRKKIIISRTQVRSLEAYKGFYAWSKIYKRGAYLRVSETWLDTLRARRRDVNAGREYHDHVFWSLENVLTVAAWEPTDIFDERARAAICFLFLSGMRAGAFCTLPVDCVDIQTGRIEQKPSRGVETKNRKSAVTWLLQIPEIRAVVAEWDRKVRSLGCKNWFPPLKRAGLEFVLTDEGNEHKLTLKTSALSGSVGRVCSVLGLPYMSPHKLRHGHGVYGVKNARNIEELKAVSQNMMHASLGITDGLYGVLPEENVRQVLSTFHSQNAGPQAPQKQTNRDAGTLSPEVIQLARLLMEQINSQKK